MRPAREVAHEIVLTAFRRSQANLYCSAAIKGHGDCSLTCNAVTAAIEAARCDGADDMRKRAAALADGQCAAIRALPVVPE